ncbi:hypothetical protein QAD02_007236 [Eretmocerus hayati]|uniref:Uncharacterized protein n=1 Tax=Eretmocerus hayati TaxID=131215 RepID=A0ACC2N317_9HYME|nr:hypothetical protein QAD02_007236 [Eretmocerus hayati]
MLTNHQNETSHTNNPPLGILSILTTCTNIAHLYRLPKAAEKTTKEKMRSDMNRWRRESFPPHPKTFEELCKQAREERYNSILRSMDRKLECHVLVDADDCEHIIYYDKEFVRTKMRNTKYLFLDGTFKCRPKTEGIAQIFNVMGIKLGRTAPMFQVLMSRRTENAYNKVFEHIEEVCAFDKLQVAMCDFEQPLRSFVAKNWPNVHIAGCNVRFDRVKYPFRIDFHWNLMQFNHSFTSLQAIYRKLKELKVDMSDPEHQKRWDTADALQSISDLKGNVKQQMERWKEDRLAFGFAIKNTPKTIPAEADIDFDHKLFLSNLEARQDNVEQRANSLQLKEAGKFFEHLNATILYAIDEIREFERQREDIDSAVGSDSDPMDEDEPANNDAIENREEGHVSPPLEVASNEGTSAADNTIGLDQDDSLVSHDNCDVGSEPTKVVMDQAEPELSLNGRHDGDDGAQYPENLIELSQDGPNFSRVCDAVSETNQTLMDSEQFEVIVDEAEIDHIYQLLADDQETKTVDLVDVENSAHHNSEMAIDQPHITVELEIDDASCCEMMKEKPRIISNEPVTLNRTGNSVEELMHYNSTGELGRSSGRRSFMGNHDFHDTIHINRSLPGNLMPVQYNLHPSNHQGTDRAEYNNGCIPMVSIDYNHGLGSVTGSRTYNDTYWHQGAPSSNYCDPPSHAMDRYNPGT